jgi:dUTP pyrophosphatase
MQIQPNGVDFSVYKIAKFKEQGKIDFNGAHVKIPKLIDIPFDATGWADIVKGNYLITFNEHVSIPADIMAVGRPRSSMLRMGATVETAVWDAGFQGVSRSLLVVYNDLGIRIKKNARVMQVVFIKLTAKTEPYGGNYKDFKINNEVYS